MKTLHLYLIRQIVGTLLMTVAVFTFVLLLGNVLKEILALLVSRQVTFPVVAEAIGLLIPYIMSYVLPFGMLTASLLVFGRFSADQEYTAAKASGLSLISLVSPVLILAVAISGLCALINLWIAPQARGAYKNLVFKAGLQNPGNLITEDRFIDEIPGMVVYVGKKDGTQLRDIRIYNIKDNQVVSRLSAKEGTMTTDPSGRYLHFLLKEVVGEIRKSEEDHVQGPDLPTGRIEWQATNLGEYEPDPIDLSALMKEERKQKISEMNFNQLLVETQQRKAQGIDATPVQIQLHRQVAFSFACFAFTLIGIPLAIQTHRRETSLGVAISLGLLVIYYSFFILAEAMETKPGMKPYLLVWVPNFLFEAIGAYLLWRANKRR